MNADIERGFVAVIQAAMPNHEVREATSSKPLRGDAHLVIVECPESEHMAGPLYRATVRAWLTTNPHDLSEAYHGTAAGLLSKAFAAGVYKQVSAKVTEGNTEFPASSLVFKKFSNR